MKTEEHAQHACLYCLLKGPRNGITEGNPSFSAELKCPRLLRGFFILTKVR